MISFQQRSILAPLHFHGEERNWFYRFLRSLKTLKIFGVLVKSKNLFLASYFYCFPVWGNSVKSNIHNWAASSAEFRWQDCFLVKEIWSCFWGSYFLKWLNVSEKILFNDLVSVFKCLNRSSTRRSGNLRLPRCRLSCRGFYFRGAKRWNDLPKDLQSIKGIKLFKKRLFNRIFNE